jgi:hypothetical protein
MTCGAGPAEAGSGAAFSYHRAIAPMLWVLVGLMIIEIAVVHLLLALWSRRAALILSLVSLVLLGWFLSFIRSFKRCPIWIGPMALTWRIGHLRSLTVPLSQVAGLRSDWTLADLEAAGVFNGALVAHPNIVVALDQPVRMGRRTVRCLAHRLDDPAGFTQALAATVVPKIASLN